MKYFTQFITPLLLFLMTGFLISCSDDGPTGSIDEPDDQQFEYREVSYSLNAISNSGEIPDGVEATAIFQELNDSQTLVTLELEGGSTESGLTHTAHIHENDAETGGGIVYFLGPIDGLEGSPGTSHFVLDVVFDALLDFDGYINIHESNSALSTILSQGNIGSNSDEEVVESNLTPAENPETKEYNLSAKSNNGQLTNGAEAVAVFQELTSGQTLVKLELVNGSTETELSHNAHIHFNNVVEGGGIAYFLGPIDGLAGSPGVSYAVVNESFEFLTDFDGFINIHESNANLGAIVSQGNIGSNEGMTTLRSASFTLNANPNSGAVSEGVNATATFWELNENETIVTLNMDESTGASAVHTSHIHFNSADEGGNIAYFLTPIDGTDPDASSARIIEESFDTLIEFDGYINIHESVENLGFIVSQGNIGANSDVEIKLGLDAIHEPQSKTYDLRAVSNDGDFFPGGVSGTANFLEVTADLTIVTLDLDTDGATGTTQSLPAHIHNNSAEEGGGIAWYLGAIDAMDPDSRSSMLISESFNMLTSFNGHINIHESLTNLGAILTQGNIDTNGDNGDDGGNDDGY